MIKTEQMIDQIANNAIRLSNKTDLQPLIKAAGKVKYALLGEASHGTSWGTITAY